MLVCREDIAFVAWKVLLARCKGMGPHDIARLSVKYADEFIAALDIEQDDREEFYEFAAGFKTDGLTKDD